jgi:hypothetical protein
MMGETSTLGEMFPCWNSWIATLATAWDDLATGDVTVLYIHEAL